MQDEQMWIQGKYIYEATATAVDNVLNGRRSKLEYRDKSYTKEYEESHLSEQQKKQGTIALFEKLKTMQANFEKNHPKKDVVEDE